MYTLGKTTDIDWHLVICTCEIIEKNNNLTFLTMLMLKSRS
ncbi:hypothetical protein EaACW_0017 [Erwinia amylovora ACW56400]|uniref:Uncharacterized protein n=2 Tax=Erwinia amylovora TaxID=552 RepID=A0A830ZY12_ERWAM|nr:hypothetical protein EaACW_0017 [Erwinia amylovora ACW56400]CBX78838.1 hypothetical protein predicted by Glimmer/Critica [Erwinia amylovora ATCC BAA-2158]CCO76865.1 hypothetical protein BN432_0017 [Erwinia amylovora Ea356]CCO80641.1 hypothetical protein BN433_0019 [Erwinia amylovora Ea266]CCO84456.1 hypothetical protein BN434_0017 [Erwinia amylovora CFBP 2585]CCO88239.1 hypothetical protein BN435_0016 [Erwinia amylovora 01SFR-BO]CCO91997.1 hypothetical protein BN437_0016 [Erwinia amylovora